MYREHLQTVAATVVIIIIIIILAARVSLVWHVVLCTWNTAFQVAASPAQ